MRWTARSSGASCTRGRSRAMTDPAAGRPPRAAIRDAALPADAPAPAKSEASSARAGTATLLRTEELTRHFKIGSALSKHTLHAVDDISLTIGEHEIVALAGE